MSKVKLTIVYSSHKGDEYDKKFEQKIKNTIGLPDKLYTIKRYVNNNEYSLTEVYQRGLNESTTDYVVFTHNDVDFDTEGWGKRVIKNLDKTDFGIIGVAGTTSLPDTARWWQDPTKMVGIVNHTHNNKKWTSTYSAKLDGEIVPTVVVDGVFFYVNKQKLKYNFDKTIEGFHFYDVDFSFGNFLENVKVGVGFDILITHHSMGEPDTEWEMNKQLFMQKYDEQLPTSINPEIYYKKQRKTKTNNNVSLAVIIPTKENYEYLKDCVDSIRENTKHQNYTIYVADTGSSEETLAKIKNELVSDNLQLIEYDYYNFAKINNDVVKNHINDEQLLLFCNNDIKLINNAIDIMLDEYYKMDSHQLGTIGCRLHFEDNHIQHAGVMININEQKQLSLGHIGFGSSYGYYNGINKNAVGSTAAFMMTPRKVFEEIGGFNEDYIECFEDVQYNLECRYRGLTNLVLADAVCYHYESVTRNNTEDKEQRMKEDMEKRLLPYINKKNQEQQKMMQNV